MDFFLLFFSPSLQPIFFFSSFTIHSQPAASRLPSCLCMSFFLHIRLLFLCVDCDVLILLFRKKKPTKFSPCSFNDSLTLVRYVFWLCCCCAVYALDFFQACTLLCHEHTILLVSLGSKLLSLHRKLRCCRLLPTTR